MIPKIDFAKLLRLELSTFSVIRVNNAFLVPSDVSILNASFSS